MPVLPRVLRRVATVLLSVLVAVTALVLPTSPAVAADADPSRVGFSNGGGFPWLSDENLARELDLIRSSGARWVRVDFDWSGVEHVRGQYDWKNLDRVVGAVRSRGLQVLALPAYTPDWARPAGTSSHTPPSDPAPFAAFVAAAAARYVPQGVTAYEIWNEPNIRNFWAPKPDVAAYAALLKATASAVRAAAPGAQIVTAGLSPASDTADGAYVDPRTFLRRLYELGAQSSFDAVGVHPYSFPALPSDASTASWNTFQKMFEMRAYMVSKGDAGKKIWLTETGAPTGTSAQAVSEQKQAAIVSDTLSAVRGLDWAGPVFFYSTRDGGTDLTNREHNFGLLRKDFSPKQAWSTLVSALAASGLGSQPPGSGSLRTPPPAPAGLAAAMRRSSAVLTWQPTAGATEYVVERSLTAPGATGQSWERVGAVTGTQHVDPMTSVGRRWYRVVAVNEVGESSPSSTATARLSQRARRAVGGLRRSSAAVFGPQLPQTTG